MRIVVDKKIPFIKGVLEQYAEVVYLDGSEIRKRDVQNADALVIRTRTKCDKALLAGTKVRLIASATIGFDHIDTRYCEAHDIAWTNAAGCNSASVNQYIAASLIHLAEELKFELGTKTIGIVGVGNVGTRVAAFCRALGMKVLLNDPPRERREGSAEFVCLDAILERSDIITLHVPLNREGEDKTLNMVDGKFLGKLQKRQILINTSRGEVVEGEALKTCLKEKRIAECVLDVWEHEPEIDRELLGLVEIGTPHIAGYSVDGKANGTAMSVQALGRFFGLNLNSWFPTDLPLPVSTLIELDCGGMKEQDVVGDLIHRTYDILADDARLRLSPQTFERQRGEYPLRREFPAYTVRLLNAQASTKKKIQGIGFNLTP